MQLADDGGLYVKNGRLGMERMERREKKRRQNQIRWSNRQIEIKSREMHRKFYSIP